MPRELGDIGRAHPVGARDSIAVRRAAAYAGPHPWLPVSEPIATLHYVPATYRGSDAIGFTRRTSATSGWNDVAYYETDPTVLDWFDRALTHGSSYVRIAALCLLGDVDSARRASWLRRAQSDPVGEVVATAVLTEAFVTVADSPSADLFESDFAESLERGDLIWEWEYDIVVAHNVVVQLGTRTTWAVVEDDALARRLALQKAYCGKEHEVSSATAIIVGKRFVNQYTRSPRSMAEASWWMRRGRPRYRE